MSTIFITGASRGIGKAIADVWELANRNGIENGMFYFRGKIRSW